MRNGLVRFYKIWNSARGDNWIIYDRSTGDKVASHNDMEKAEDKVRELNEADRKERGLSPVDAVETPSTYFGTRNRDAQEIAPMHRFS